MTIRNPFRDRTLKATFDAVVSAYIQRHKAIWRPPGCPRPGNGWSNNFWRGYDGTKIPVWGNASRRTPAYACFLAGQLVRAEEDRHILSSEEDPSLVVGQVLLDEENVSWVYVGYRITSVGSRDHHFVRALTGERRLPGPLWTYNASNPETIRRKFQL